MTDDPYASLDGRLRDTFKTDPSAAARIAEAAFADQARAPRRSRLRVAAVVCPAAAVTCLAMALAFWPSRPAPQVEPAAVPLSGSFADGLLVVPLPDGSIAIMGGEARQNRPQYGYGIVLVEGELR
jgi:hypothetical protein